MKPIIQTLIVLPLLISTSIWAENSFDPKEIELFAGDMIVAMNEEEMEKFGEEMGELGKEIGAMGEEIGEMVAEITKTVREAIAHGAFIGILLETDDKETSGVLVIGVTPGGPAQEAGIKSGDIIIAINSESIAKSEQGSPAKNLMRALKKVKPGDRVRVELKREGETLSMELVAASRKDHTKSGYEFLGDEFKKRFLHLDEHELMKDGYLAGVRLYELNPDLGAYFGSETGMLVLDVPDETDIPLKGGDVILMIGDRIPRSPSHTWRIIHSYESGEVMNMKILRKGEEQIITLTKP